MEIKVILNEKGLAIKKDKKGINLFEEIAILEILKQKTIEEMEKNLKLNTRKIKD